jgi:hypothetical protein
MGIGETVADVPGLLRAEDEEKLYELASETEGPILDIGTYRGRSAAAGVRRDLEVLERVVPHDGLLLFHDFAVDARSLESPRMQSLQRLRWPAGRLVRRLRGR